MTTNNNNNNNIPPKQQQQPAQQPQQRPQISKRIPEGATPEYLNQETFGGYTVKQRLREEVESPFRKVRLLFFASSVVSALTALYFSALSTLKASSSSILGYGYGYADALPLDEALTSDAINLGAAVICGVLAYREYQAGQANLERIARGGKLASLLVEPATTTTTSSVGGSGDGGRQQKLAEYRRGYRVLIAAGGASYISKLARSLCVDHQLAG